MNKNPPHHPFGTEVTKESLRQLFTQQTPWEDKYRQLILLGKQLPPLPVALRCREIEIEGCENRVWLGHTKNADGTLHFYGESEGRIVRGLLAVLLCAIEGKTAQQIALSDPLALFNELGLLDQLSASRGHGLTALVNTVQRMASLT